MNVQTNYVDPIVGTKKGAPETKEPVEFGQHGLNMIVPPGYPNDTFNIRASSGEGVIVLTPGQMGREEINNSFLWSPTIQLSNQIDADAFMDRLMQRLEERLS